MTFSASPLTPDMTTTPAGEELWRRTAQRVLTAVTEAMPQIPSADPLMPDAPAKLAADVTLPEAAGTAISAYLGGRTEGRILLVVGEDVLAALQAASGAVEPAQALTPALETLATALGAQLEGLPTAIGVEGCLDVLTDGTTVFVPLLDGEGVRALVGVSIVEPEAPAAGAAGGAAGGPGVPNQRSAAQAAKTWGIDMLRDVEMEVTCELGRTRMTVRQLLALAPGDVVELDRLAGSPADLLVNGTLLARGEVVVVDESFGLRITEIVTRDQT